MKWFNVLSAVTVLAMAASASAAEFGRPGRVLSISTGVLQPELAPTQDATKSVDFPLEAYPVGFQNNRGLGFMGACCLPRPASGKDLWQGYCETKDCHAKLCDGAVRGTFRGSCCSPVAVGGFTSCDPCSGPGANYWPMSPGSGLWGRRLSGFARPAQGFFPGEGKSIATPDRPQPATNGAAPAPSLATPPTEPVPPSEAAPTPPVDLPPPPATPAPAPSTTTHDPAVGNPTEAGIRLPRPASTDKSAHRVAPSDLRLMPQSF